MYNKNQQVNDLLYVVISGWNDTTGVYTVPYTGYYHTIAYIRTADDCSGNLGVTLKTGRYFFWYDCVNHSDVVLYTSILFP